MVRISRSKTKLVHWWPQKLVNRKYVSEDKASDARYLFMADYPRIYLFYFHSSKGQRRQTRRPNHFILGQADSVLSWMIPYC